MTTPAAEEQEKRMDLRILCYNVCGFPWNAHPVRDMVFWMTQNADVIALQEVWCNHKTWAACFAECGWIFQKPPHENHISGVFGSGLVTAWNPRLFVGSDVRFYPFLSAVGFDQFVTKGWMRVTLRHRVTGVSVRLLNTHMQSDYEVCDDLWHHVSHPVRRQQCRQLALAEGFGASTTPRQESTLIVGDFNTRECLLPHARFLNPQTIPTFPGSAKHLDHIAVALPLPLPLPQNRQNHLPTLLSHTVVTSVPPSWSDHWPIQWIVRFAC